MQVLFYRLNHPISHYGIIEQVKLGIFETLAAESHGTDPRSYVL